MDKESVEILNMITVLNNAYCEYTKDYAQKMDIDNKDWAFNIRSLKRIIESRSLKNNKIDGNQTTKR